MRKAQRTALMSAALAAAFSPAPASAAPRQPTGPWVVDYSNDQCFLDRNYGTDVSPVLLAIRRVPMDPDVSVGVYTTGGKRDPAVGVAKVGTGSGNPVEAGYRAYAVPGKNLRSFTAYVRGGGAMMSSAAAPTVVAIHAPGEVDDSFAVPELAGGLRALDACVADLAKSWGMAPELQRRVKTLPRPMRSDYLSTNDYSVQELNQNANARPQVRLWIDEAGKPLDCVPLQAGGPSNTFGDRTCRLLLQRAAFHPAVDVDGKPMRSIMVYTVDWVVG